MKSRTRAVVFALGALSCAGLSAAVAGTAEAPGEGGFGPLVPVVVTSAPLDAGTVVGRNDAERALEERRVPEAFVPPDALGVPGEALGRKLGSSLPVGSYVTVAAFKVREPGSSGGRGGPPQGTTPVEITVTGAGALASARTDSGDRVDVIVSGDSAPGPSAGGTYVAVG
ncbi:MAG TPA: SAF domain-containing protein, partial [Solirubrobacterales bacterium]|nr:SAF domain-containing protein [Solirubrobacterales bacterium]